MDLNVKGESLPSEASLRIERKIKLSNGKYSLTLTSQRKLQKLLQIVNRTHTKKTVSRHITVKIIILHVNIFVLSSCFISKVSKGLNYTLLSDVALDISPQIFLNIPKSTVIK